MSAQLCLRSCNHPALHSKGFQILVIGLTWPGLDEPIHTLVDLTVWPTALSCWKSQSLELDCQSLRKQFFPPWVALYMAWLMQSSQTKICPIPALLQHPLIIIDPPTNFTAGAKHYGLMVSPGLHPTIIWPADGKSRKLDSSKKMTSCPLRSNPYGLYQMVFVFFFS